MGVFTKNILHAFATQVVGFFLAIGVSVIITRGLGPEGKGVFALSMLILSLLMMFGGFGLNPATTYYTGNKKYSTGEILGSTLALTLFISIAGIIAGLIMIFFFNTALFPEVKRTYLFLALSIFPIAYLFDLTLQILLGLQQVQTYNNIKLFNALLFALFLALLFFSSSLSVASAIIANILSYVFPAILTLFLAIKASGAFLVKFSKAYIKDAFSYGLKTYLASMLYYVRYPVNIFLVNAFLNPASVGFYVTALGLSEVTQWLSKSTATVLFPKVASQDIKKDGEVSPIICRNILFITIIGILPPLFLARWMITLLYSQAFAPSIIPFQILLLGAPAFAGWMILHTDFFARGKPMINTYLFAISIGLNVILNIVWIPSFGIVGGAWALTVSYYVVFILTVIIFGKISRSPIQDLILVKRSDFYFYKNMLQGIFARFMLKKT